MAQVTTLQGSVVVCLQHCSSYSSAPDVSLYQRKNGTAAHVCMACTMQLQTDFLLLFCCCVLMLTCVLQGVLMGDAVFQELPEALARWPRGRLPDSSLLGPSSICMLRKNLASYVCAGVGAVNCFELSGCCSLTVCFGHKPATAGLASPIGLRAFLRAEFHIHKAGAVLVPALM
jgi:hypothetical protein